MFTNLLFWIDCRHFCLVFTASSSIHIPFFRWNIQPRTHLDVVLQQIKPAHDNWVLAIDLIWYGQESHLITSWMRLLTLDNISSSSLKSSKSSGHLFQSNTRSHPTYCTAPQKTMHIQQVKESHWEQWENQNIPLNWVCRSLPPARVPRYVSLNSSK